MSSLGEEVRRRIPSAIQSPYFSRKVSERVDSDTQVSLARRLVCISTVMLVRPSASVSAKVSGRWLWLVGAKAGSKCYIRMVRR
jgi:hypothetical protein